MLIKSYVDYWISFRNNNYSNKMPLLYLKDWHCKKYSNLPIYDVPKFFSSDWLNEYLNANPQLNDDYMFVYMGPKGSWFGFLILFNKIFLYSMFKIFFNLGHHYMSTFLLHIVGQQILLEKRNGYYFLLRKKIILKNQ